MACEHRKCNVPTDGGTGNTELSRRQAGTKEVFKGHLVRMNFSASV